MATPNRFVAAVLGGALLAAAALGCATTSPAQQADLDRKARAHYEVAMNHLREGRTGNAISELLMAQQLAPKDPWVDLALAEAYRLKMRDDEAEKHLLRALSTQPNFHAAKINLAALYIETERYEPAIQISQELLNDPTFPVPWKALTNQGYAYYKLGKKAEARQTLERALEFYSDFWPAWLDLAVIDQDEGHHMEALEGLEKVLALKPGPMAEAEAHYRIANIYVSLGNREQAVHHLTVAAETRPSGEWGKRSADYLKRLR